MQNESVEFRVVDSSETLEHALKIRDIVFREEQGIPVEYDEDGKDAEALHVLAVLDGVYVGTGRVVISDIEGVLSRIAVLKQYRGQGVAKGVVEELERQAVIKGVTHFSLLPHIYLEDFYKRLGYIREHSFHYNVAGHSLIKMYKL